MKNSTKGWIFSGVLTMAVGAVIVATGFGLVPGLVLMGLGAGMTALGTTAHVLDQTSKSNTSYQEGIEQEATKFSGSYTNVSKQTKELITTRTKADAVISPVEHSSKEESSNSTSYQTARTLNRVGTFATQEAAVSGIANALSSLLNLIK